MIVRVVGRRENNIINGDELSNMYLAIRDICVMFDGAIIIFCNELRSLPQVRH